LQQPLLSLPFYYYFYFFISSSTHAYQHRAQASQGENIFWEDQGMYDISIGIAKEYVSVQAIFSQLAPEKDNIPKKTHMDFNQCVINWEYQSVQTSKSQRTK